MIKIKEAEKIKNIFQKIGRKIFKQPAILFAFLLLVDLIIGGILFWQTILSPKVDIAKSQPLLVLNKANLDKFIQELTIQEADFQRNSIEKSPDIFTPLPTSTATSSKIQ
jgi:hypothetical protein